MKLRLEGGEKNTIADNNSISSSKYVYTNHFFPVWKQPPLNVMLMLFMFI